MEDKKKISIYNAIQNLYNMDNVTWQEVLAVLYNTVADIDGKFDILESKFGILLPKEVREEIKRLTESGQLADIINGEVFEGLNTKINNTDKKVDENKKELETQLINMSMQINTHNGEECTQDLIECINTIGEGGQILFPQGRKYKIGSIPKITKNVTIDFNSCTLEPITDNDVFILGFTGETQFNNRIRLLNYVFTKSATNIPNTIIKIDGAINSELRGNFRSANAVHSLIHNYKGYGTKIRGELRYCNCPRNIYLSSSSTEIHSFDIDIDVDITGATGLGIEAEGGTGSIKGVIEGCNSGGINFNGNHIIQAMMVSIHSESNKYYDIKIGTDVIDSTGATNQGNLTIINSLLGVNSLNVDENFKAIIYGSGYNINVDSCLIAPNTGIAPISDSSKNNNIFFKGRKTNLIVDETKNNLFLMDWDNVKFTKDVQCGVITPKSVNTSKITSNDSTNGLSIFLPDNKQLYFKPTSFLPPIDYALGGRWNMLTNVFSKNITLQSSDGNAWTIKVDNSGVISATKVV